MIREIQVLEKEIINPIIAWDQSLEKYPEKFNFGLDRECLEELKQNENKLSNQNPTDFKILNKFVRNLKNDVLIKGCGFFIINGKELLSFNNEQKKNYESMCS